LLPARKQLGVQHAPRVNRYIIARNFSLFFRRRLNWRRRRGTLRAKIRDIGRFSGYQQHRCPPLQNAQERGTHSMGRSAQSKAEPWNSAKAGPPAHGAADAGSQDGSDCINPLEEGRGVRSRTSEATNSISAPTTKSGA